MPLHSTRLNTASNVSWKKIVFPGFYGLNITQRQWRKPSHPQRDRGSYGLDIPKTHQSATATHRPYISLVNQEHNCLHIHLSIRTFTCASHTACAAACCIIVSGRHSHRSCALGYLSVLPSSPRCRQAQSF